MVDLYQHQKDFLDLKPVKHLLAWECRTGKTCASIRGIELNCATILVVCPKSLKEQWVSEVDKFQTLNKEWKVVTKEEFKKDYKTIGKYEGVIIDEAHYFSGMKSLMFKRMVLYIRKHDPKNVYLLTATPYMSTPWNIRCLARLLGQKTKDGSQFEYDIFKEKFFSSMRLGQMVVPVIRENIEPEIAKLVNFLGSTVKMNDCVDMPEQIFTVEYFNLTPEQKRAIKEIEINENIHIVKWTKIHQICGGSLKSDGYVEDQFFKNEKIRRLKNLVKQNKKIVIVCRYNNEIDYIANELSEYKVLKIRGDVKDRNSIVNEARALDECIVIVQAQCSEGYGLETFPVMIFYSYSFSLKDYIQMIGRIQNMKHLDKKLYISLVVKDSIDDAVFECIKGKKKFDIEIYNK